MENNNNFQKTEFSVQKAYKRLDVFLSEMLPSHTRSNIKNLIVNGKITVNNKAAKPSSNLKEGDFVCFFSDPPKEVAIEPQNIPIDIVYQDDDIAVINKAQGMVVHPAAGNESGTLVNAIMYHIKDLSGINGELRPGIVHRIDKNTSGLLVIAKNDNAHVNLQEQIKSKTAKRIYRALVYGNIKEDSVFIDAPIGRHKTDRKKMAVTKDGREAQTEIKVLERFGDTTYIECSLKTGRTHQIRVHVKHIGHPIVGDDVYTTKKPPFALKGQLLHAVMLKLVHPKTGEEMTFEAPLPDYFEKALKIFRK